MKNVIVSAFVGLILASTYVWSQGGPGHFRPIFDGTDFLDSSNTVTIAEGSIEEVDLDAAGTPASSDVLTYDGTSGFTWATQSSLSVGSATNATTASTANAGDDAADFFGVGSTVVQHGAAVTDLAGTGLSVSNGTLNASVRIVEVFTPTVSTSSVSLNYTPTAATAVSCAMTGYTLSQVGSNPSTGQFSVSGQTVTLGLAANSGDNVVCTYTYS